MNYKVDFFKNIILINTYIFTIFKNVHILKTISLIELLQFFEIRWNNSEFTKILTYLQFYQRKTWHSSFHSLTILQQIEWNILQVHFVRMQIGNNVYSSNKSPIWFANETHYLSAQFLNPTLHSFLIPPAIVLQFH